jgi:hypothetical protein
MKRNLLLLAVMILTVFGFSNVGLAQDPGNPDILIMESYPADSVFDKPGPDFARIPLYITHDVPDPAEDSLAAAVIPICYTHSNPAKYCSLSAYWNAAAGATAFTAPRGIFRDLDVPNFMKGLNALGGGEEWSQIILDLTTGTPNHFWLTAIASGTEDQRMGPGTKILFATMTFKLEDSMVICLDTCFWPPSSRLSFAAGVTQSYTFIPEMSWKVQGEGEYCHDYYIIPNQPPVFTTCPGNDTRSTNGSFQSSEFVNEDPDGQVVSAAASFVGTGVANVNIVFTVPPPAQTIKGYVTYDVVDHCQAGGTVTLTDIDNLGATNVIPCTFTITLTDAAPVVTCPPNATFKYCDGYSGLATATDPNGDPVTFSGTGNPVGLDVNPTTGAITWNPDCSNVGGPFTITVKATETGGTCALYSECTFQLTVTNAAPTFTLCPDDGAAMQNMTFVSSAFATSDDCPPVVVTATINPPVNPDPDPVIVGNHVEWATTSNEEGIYTITLTATDECGLTATCDFTVEVKKGLENHVFIEQTECVDPGALVSVSIFAENFISHDPDASDWRFY